MASQPFSIGNFKQYKPPFPWFGGKSMIAHEVWNALGNVDSYIEPFFGSGAVLFLRPDDHDPGTETVNDADGFVANFWRAMQSDVAAVAEHADWPVNECDLHARHMWLVERRESLVDRLCGDPDYFDAKIAGWWCWGQCCWIGGGWCSGKGPWQSVDGVMTKVGNGRGVKRQRPHLGDNGVGVNRPGTELVEYLQWFAARLRRVRVCCGDWSRVCTNAAMNDNNSKTIGVFLDPPYADTAGRDSRIYSVDSESVAHDVRRWAIENGSREKMRIVLAGYQGEHDMPDNWTAIRWKAQGGMANQGNNRGKENRHRETLWCSPHCLKAGKAEGTVRSLF